MDRVVRYRLSVRVITFHGRRLIMQGLRDLICFTTTDQLCNYLLVPLLGMAFASRETGSR